jgi:hypothetical protein
MRESNCSDSWMNVECTEKLVVAYQVYLVKPCNIMLQMALTILSKLWVNEEVTPFIQIHTMYTVNPNCVDSHSRNCKPGPIT